MENTFVDFEWDKGNQEKCQKHGVSIAEIEALFAHQPAIFPDGTHSKEEIRLLAIGKNVKGRYIFLAFTMRDHLGKRYLRPISARYMHQKEIDNYEEENP